MLRSGFKLLEDVFVRWFGVVGEDGLAGFDYGDEFGELHGFEFVTEAGSGCF